MYDKDIFSMDTCSSSADSSNESTDPEMLFTTSNKAQCVGGCRCECGCVRVSGWGQNECETKIKYASTLTYHTPKFVAFQKKFIIIFDNFLSIFSSRTILYFDVLLFGIFLFDIRLFDDFFDIYLFDVFLFDVFQQDQFHLNLDL